MWRGVLRKLQAIRQEKYLFVSVRSKILMFEAHTSNVIRILDIRTSCIMLSSLISSEGEPIYQMNKRKFRQMTNASH